MTIFNGYGPGTRWSTAQDFPNTFPGESDKVYTFRDYINWGGQKMKWVPPHSVPYSEPPTKPAYRADELYKMPDNQWKDLVAHVAAENFRRNREVEVTLEQKQAGYDQWCSFLMGVCHAMMCRAALRLSRGHRPFSPDGKGSGGTPSSGECWNIWDVAGLGECIYNNKTPYGLTRNPMCMTPRQAGAMAVSGFFVHNHDYAF